MLTRTYDLDMVPSGIPLYIHLSQYDSDVTLVFQLYASQGTLNIPYGVRAAIRGTKQDGDGIVLNATIISGSLFSSLKYLVARNTTLFYSGLQQ